MLLVSQERPWDTGVMDTVPAGSTTHRPVSGYQLSSSWRNGVMVLYARCTGAHPAMHTNQPKTCNPLYVLSPVQLLLKCCTGAAGPEASIYRLLLAVGLSISILCCCSVSCLEPTRRAICWVRGMHVMRTCLFLCVASLLATRPLYMQPCCIV
jgi:hypothetical protein